MEFPGKHCQQSESQRGNPQDLYAVENLSAEFSPAEHSHSLHPEKISVSLGRLTALSKKSGRMFPSQALMIRWEMSPKITPYTPCPVKLIATHSRFNFNGKIDGKVVSQPISRNMAHTNA